MDEKRVVRRGEPRDIFHDVDFSRSMTMVDNYMRSFNRLMKGMFEDQFITEPIDVDQTTSIQHTLMNNPDLIGFTLKDENTYSCVMDVDKDFIEGGDVKIFENDGYVSVDAKKRVDSDETKEGRKIRSSVSKSIHKRIPIPDDAVKNTAIAKYEHGKLEITIQRNPSKVQRKKEIPLHR